MSTPSGSNKRGGRPRKQTKRKRVNITLHPEVRREADRLAFQDHRSLSSFVEHCLRLEIERIKAAAISALPA